MRRPMSASVAVLFALAAGCAPSPSSVPPSPRNPPATDPSPTQSVDTGRFDAATAPEIQRGLAEALEALGDSFGHDFPAEDIIPRLDVPKALRIGDQAFAVGIWNQPDGRYFAIVGAFALEGSRWSLVSFRPDFAPFEDYPSPGSDFVGVIGHGEGGIFVEAGIGDPTITTVETVSADATVFDADWPTDGVVLVQSNWGVLQARRDAEVIQAFTVPGPGQPPVDLGEFDAGNPAEDPDARRVAGSFVRAFLSGGWRAAARFFHPDFEPELSLRAFESVVRPGSWTIFGSSTQVGDYFVYPIRDGAERRTLNVGVRLDEGTWWVQLVGTRVDRSE